MVQKNKKFKIILINPPLSLEERYGRDLKRFGAISEPLGLAYLAASLEKQSFQVAIMDCLALKFDIGLTVEKLRLINPDLIGITVLTPMYVIVKRLAEKLKENLPECKIVIGGAHPTALPKETLLEIRSVDFVCIGEGEKTIVELSNYLLVGGKKEEIAGLAFRGPTNEVIINKHRIFEADLDSIPPPARQLLPMQKYHLTASRVKDSQYCPTLIIARGCPFNCAFCSHPFGRSFRHHSVRRIISEIKSLIKNYHVKQLNFEADTLTVDKNFLFSLCQALIDERINQTISWTCESRINTVDRSLLEKMKEAGCWQISYGIESGNQHLLDIINKGITLDEIRRTIALTKEIGITVRGFFMLGLPTETLQESWQTINFAKELDPLWAQFTIMIPYPGTPLFDRLKKKNKIRHFNWSEYNTWSGWTDKQLPYMPENREEKELKRLQRQAMVNFYLRPKIIIKFMLQLNSFESFKKYFRGFITLIKSKLIYR